MNVRELQKKKNNYVYKKEGMIGIKKDAHKYTQTLKMRLVNLNIGRNFALKFSKNQRKYLKK